MEELRPLKVPTCMFVVTRPTPNKANGNSKGNSRVSHYGCTYIQEFSCRAFPLNARSSHAWKPDPRRRNKGGSGTQDRHMPAWKAVVPVCGTTSHKRAEWRLPRSDVKTMMRGGVTASWLRFSQTPPLEVNYAKM